MYPADNFETGQQLDEAFRMLQGAEELNFPMATDTENSGGFVNEYGLLEDHAFSVLSIFTMRGNDGVEHRMVTIRGPNGFTEYRGKWNAKDPAWTQQLVD
jgi:hypothetical protein